VQSVYVRRSQHGIAVAREVPITLVVSQHQNDIGPAGFRLCPYEPSRVTTTAPAAPVHTFQESTSIHGISSRERSTRLFSAEFSHEMRRTTNPFSGNEANKKAGLRCPALDCCGAWCYLVSFTAMHRPSAKQSHGALQRLVVAKDYRLKTSRVLSAVSTLPAGRHGGFPVGSDDQQEYPDGQTDCFGPG